MSLPTLASLLRGARDTREAFGMETGLKPKHSDAVQRSLDERMGEEMDKIAKGAKLLQAEPCPVCRNEGSVIDGACLACDAGV